VGYLQAKLRVFKSRVSKHAALNTSVLLMVI